MPTTPNEGLTYPSSASNTNLWEHFQTLAEDVDDRLALRQARGVMAEPTVTPLDGPGTSGTTDTRDNILGDYEFTAETDRRYRVWCTLLLNGSVAGDRYICQVRDGGASTPTGASSSVAATSKVIAAVGSNGREGVVVTGTFTPTAGVHTLGLFVARFNGSGVGTPVGVRELYVEDIGPA